MTNRQVKVPQSKEPYAFISTPFTVSFCLPGLGILNLKNNSHLNTYCHVDETTDHIQKQKMTDRTRTLSFSLSVELKKS